MEYMEDSASIGQDQAGLEYADDTGTTLGSECAPEAGSAGLEYAEDTRSGLEYAQDTDSKLEYAEETASFAACDYMDAGEGVEYMDKDDSAISDPDYQDAVDETAASQAAAAKVPDFLREDAARQKALEARKKKLFHMQYHPSPLLDIVNEGNDKASALLPSSSSGNWNERFQRLMDLEDSFEKFDQLRSLAHDFVHAAEAYGRIIISEMCLPDAQKTIQPTAIGGIAGGQKYIIQDILFKFATDFEGLYGGDAYAMKAAGHDISGLISYMAAIEVRPAALRSLHVPLMALIDFRGYRLVAICLLPISRSTICYGSYDAGKTVYQTFDECNLAMKQVGEFLNIRGHKSRAHPDYLFFAPIDIEAHRGHDGKFYVLDFARYMPPQPPSGKWGGTLYELLRPELVRQSPKPLSPDAFSSFGSPEETAECQKDIIELFERLKRPAPGGIIYDYALLIDNTERTESEISDSPELDEVSTALRIQEVLVREMHGRGINMRFLGLLRSFCKGRHIRLFLLRQCLARLWKGELQHLWRDTMRDERSPSEEPFRRITARFLNSLLHKDAYWSTLKARLVSKFPSCLSEEESTGDVDLRSTYPKLYSVSMSQLFVFVNVEMEKKTLGSFQAATATGGEALARFSFVAGDLVSIGCRTRHISTVDKSDAYASMYLAQSMLKTEPDTSARLLDLALTKLETALKTSGADWELQYKLCACRVEVFRLKSRLNDFKAIDAERKLCEDALVALTKRLEQLGTMSPMLPTVRLLDAEFQLLAAKSTARGTSSPNAVQSAFEESLKHAIDALDSYQLFAQSQSQLSSEKRLSGAIGFLRRCIRVMVVFSRAKASQSFSSSEPFLDATKRLVTECIEFDKASSTATAHPIVYVWLWWLLLQHAHSMETARLKKDIAISVAPVDCVQQFLADANAFLLKGLAIDPSLKRNFLSLLNASGSDPGNLVPVLSLLVHSPVIREGLLTVVREWASLSFSAVKLSAQGWNGLSSLAVGMSHLQTLELRTCEGMETAHLMLILNDPTLRQTLEKVSFPNCQIIGLQKEVPFAKLRALRVSQTSAIDQAQVQALVSLCPELEKLDLSSSNVRLDVSSKDWIPSSLVKLDLGCAKNSPDNQALRELIESGALDNLRFLGLAQSFISDHDLDLIMSRLIKLSALDLFQCLYLDDAAVHELIKAMPTLALRNVWLPCGGWYPVLQDGEEVVIRATSGMSLNNPVFDARGKSFARANQRGGTQTYVEYTLIPEAGMRRLHKECVEGNNAAKRPLNALLGKLTGSMGKFTWFDGANEKGQPLASVPVVHGGARPAHMTMHMMTALTYGGADFELSAKLNAFSKKVDSLILRHKGANDGKLMSCTRRMQPVTKVTMWRELPVFIFHAAFFVIKALNPSVMDVID